MFVLKSTYDKMVASLEARLKEALAAAKASAVFPETAIPQPKPTFAFNFGKVSVFSIERLENKNTHFLNFNNEVQEWTWRTDIEQHNNLVAAWQDGATGIVVV